MGFKVPQHWGILGAKISIHDRAKYSNLFYICSMLIIIFLVIAIMRKFSENKWKRERFGLSLSIQIKP